MDRGPASEANDARVGTLRRLRAGDRVRLVSPASTPDRGRVERGAEMLSSWGLVVEIGRHAFESGDGSWPADGRQPRHDPDQHRLDVSELLRRHPVDRGRGLYIGAIDRAVTQLIASGCLDGLRGVAVGQFTRSGERRAGKWSAVDVLLDRLAPLGVPVLGGLPIGHGPRPVTVPLGTTAVLDTTSGTLTVEPATH